jgi:hypothetical protein
LHHFALEVAQTREALIHLYMIHWT